MRAAVVTDVMGGSKKFRTCSTVEAAPPGTSDGFDSMSRLSSTEVDVDESYCACTYTIILQAQFRVLSLPPIDWRALDLVALASQCAYRSALPD